MFADMIRIFQPLPSFPSLVRRGLGEVSKDLLLSNMLKGLWK
jgi:hypothetical protein